MLLANFSKAELASKAASHNRTLRMKVTAVHVRQPSARFNGQPNLAVIPSSSTSHHNGTERNAFCSSDIYPATTSPENVTSSRYVLTRESAYRFMASIGRTMHRHETDPQCLNRNSHYLSMALRQTQWTESSSQPRVVVIAHSRLQWNLYSRLHGGCY